jgi:hypothetical protein
VPSAERTLPGGNFLIERPQSAVHDSIGPGTQSLAGEARTPRSCAAAPLSDYESGSAIRSPRGQDGQAPRHPGARPARRARPSSPEAPSGVLLLCALRIRAGAGRSPKFRRGSLGRGMSFKGKHRKVGVLLRLRRPRRDPLRRACPAGWLKLDLLHWAERKSTCLSSMLSPRRATPAHR